MGLLLHLTFNGGHLIDSRIGRNGFHFPRYVLEAMMLRRKASTKKMMGEDLDSADASKVG